MKLSVVRGGGLAGMVTRTELASDKLSAEDAKALHEKVAGAGLLEPHTDAPSPPSHPEDLSYELTVEHEGRTRTVRLRESAMPEEVRSLIEWSDSLPERQMVIEPPGSGRASQ